MYHINYRLFRELVEENTELLKNALDNGTPLTDLLSKLKTLDWLETGRRLHFNVSMRKAFDILPSAYMGLLSYTQSNGTDAIKVNPDGSITEYELKTAEINSARMWKTPQGTMYTGQANIKNRYCIIKSALRASYAIHSISCAEAKNMKTVLLVTDSNSLTDGYFDAWEMEGKDVMNWINTDHMGQPKITKKRDIKFSTFQKYGKAASPVVPLIGYDNWAKSIKPHLITLRSGEFFPG